LAKKDDTGSLNSVFNSGMIFKRRGYDLCLIRQAGISAIIDKNKGGIAYAKYHS
jgi:hypothetical protein